MSDIETTEDDFAARRAARAVRSARVEDAKAKVTPEYETKAAAATTESAAERDDVDISGNSIHQIIEDGSLDNDTKIQKISDYLTADASDYPEARKHFAEFEAYCAYMQSESMKIDVKGIQRLVDEVKGSLKPEVEQIAANLTKVQTGIITSKDLLNVLHEARARGQTLEELTSAFRENETLINQLAALQQKLEGLAKNGEGLKVERKTAEESKKASETGFMNGLARALTGPDASIAKAIAYLEAQLESNTRETTLVADQKTKLTEERDQKLESGPLRILRTVDATEKGFSDNLVNTANSCLKLISDSTSSVQRLIQRTAFSDEQARLMNDAIAKAAFRELILKKAVVHVMDATREQAQGLLTSLNQTNSDITHGSRRGPVHD